MGNIEKVVRDGMVAVLYSPGYGAGWSTWRLDLRALIFHPRLVELVENNRRQEITEELCRDILGLEADSYVCVLGAKDLEIAWIPEGSQFEIEEYDGFESVHIIGDRDYLTA